MLLVVEEIDEFEEVLLVEVITVCVYVTQELNLIYRLIKVVLIVLNDFHAYHLLSVNVVALNSF